MTGLPTLSVVGTGAVASAVASAYVARGGRVLSVVSRDAARAAALSRRCDADVGTTEIAAVARADLVLVAVSDHALAEVGQRLVAALGDVERAPPVLHTSGALPGSALGGVPLRTGSLHPLQTFTSIDGGDDAARLSGTHWFHEGAGEPSARRLVDALDGTFHPLLEGSKALYHAGAAVLSNHLVALFASASELLAAAGISADAARGPLLHLLRGTVANLDAVGLPAALTGPIARGDVDTVSAHLAAIRDSAPQLEASYRELALLAVPVAVAKGTLGDETAARLRDLLQA